MGERRGGGDGRARALWRRAVAKGAHGMRQQGRTSGVAEATDPAYAPERTAAAARA